MKKKNVFDLILSFAVIWWFTVLSINYCCVNGQLHSTYLDKVENVYTIAVNQTKFSLRKLQKGDRTYHCNCVCITILNYCKLLSHDSHVF